MDKTDFIKVRTFLIINENDKVSINENGSFNPTDNFRYRINRYDEMFRSKVMTFINDALDLHNWAIIFGQFTTDDAFYDAKIYADNIEGFNTIKAIILDRITDIKFEFFYCGTMTDYLKTR